MRFEFLFLRLRKKERLLPRPQRGEVICFLSEEKEKMNFIDLPIFDFRGDHGY
jgi:hypothetical protein